MKIAVLIGVIVASAEAWTSPNCEHDNCYRAVLQSGLQHEIKSFCVEWLRRTDTAAIAIPTELTQFSKCDVEATRSVCSCMTHAAHDSTIPTTSERRLHSATGTVLKSHPTTAITTTQGLRLSTSSIKKVDEGRSTIQIPHMVPTSSSRSRTTHLDQKTQTTPIIRATRHVGTTPSSKAGSTTHITRTSQNSQALQTTQPAGSQTRWTTSTIYTTTTHIIISCSPEVTNCPGGGKTIFITKTIAVYTTVCPVTETDRPSSTNTPRLVSQASLTYSTGTSRPIQTSKATQTTQRYQHSSTSASLSVVDGHHISCTGQDTHTHTTPLRPVQSRSSVGRAAVSIQSTGTVTATSMRPHRRTGTTSRVPTVVPTNSNIVVTPPSPRTPQSSLPPLARSLQVSSI